METLLDKTEKSLTIMPELPELKHENENDAPELTADDGLRIARQALLREVWQMACRVGFFLSVFGGLAYLGLWCFNQVQKMPLDFVKPIYRVDLPLKGPAQKADEAKPEPNKSSLESAQKFEVKPQSLARREQHIARVRAKKRIKLAKPRTRTATAIYPGQQPAGGRIIYQDGNITEYHWH